MNHTAQGVAIAAAGLAAAAILCVAAAPTAQGVGGFERSVNDPAIKYSSARPVNRIESLNAALDAGAGSLRFEGRSGYLRSALAALRLPVDSQMLVFSKGSFQANHISEQNPRAIFFDDELQLAWVRGADLIEVAVQDATLGTVFYTLQQKASQKPRFERAMLCLGCHLTPGTKNVPGLVMFTTTRVPGELVGYVAYMNQTTPVEQRFGGWFVTGKTLPPTHIGNDVRALEEQSGVLESTAGLYDGEGYVSRTSDVAALMVFAHQAQIVNSMIRAGWEARIGGADAATLRQAASELVDNLLFIGEARLDTPLRGSSGFAERFAAAGPRDGKGRSLRELDLTRRLMRYPCSYLVYSPMFDALPPPMKSLVYERLWQVLSGAEKAPRYAALTVADRRAIVEILRETKRELPSYFVPSVK